MKHLHNRLARLEARPTATLQPISLTVSFYRATPNGPELVATRAAADLMRTNAEGRAKP